MSRTADEIKADLARHALVGRSARDDYAHRLAADVPALLAELETVRADAVSALLAQGEAAREIEAERDVARDRLDSVDAYLSELDGMGVVMGSQVAADIRALVAVPTEPAGGQG